MSELWRPRSRILCWGGGDSSGGGGATTGGGDWGSSGNYDASSFNAGGDTSAFQGTAFDASVFGTGMGGGGDWASFGDTNYSGFNASNPDFSNIGGGGLAGVFTGGGDWGSAGTYSATGTGGGQGGAFSAASGLGNAFAGEGGGGGGGYYGGGGGGSYFGGGGDPDSGGGGGGSSGGGRSSDISSFHAVTSSGQRAPGDNILGGSNTVSSLNESEPLDAAGSGGPPSQYSGGPAGHSEGGPDGDQPSGDQPSETQTTSEVAGGGSRPSVSDDTDTPSGQDLAGDAPSSVGHANSAFGPASVTGGGRSSADFDAAFGSFNAPSVDTTMESGPPVATTTSDNFYTPGADPSLSGGYVTAAPDFGQTFQSVSQPSGMDLAGDQGMGALGWGMSPALSDALQSLSTTTQQALTPGETLPTVEVTAPPATPYAPNFNEAFGSFANPPGWNPSEQTAGRAGLAEPTDWGGNPLAASTDVAAGRNFDQAFQSFETPTGMDLAGDRATAEGNINPNSLFAMGWEPANAYEGRGADYASGRASDQPAISFAPALAASPAALGWLSSVTGLSPGALLGGGAATGGLLGGLFSGRDAQQLQSPQQPIDVQIVSAPPPPQQETTTTTTPTETTPAETTSPTQTTQAAPPAQEAQQAQQQQQEAQQAPPQEAQAAPPPAEAQQAPPPTEQPQAPPPQVVTDVTTPQSLRDLGVVPPQTPPPPPQAPAQDDTRDDRAPDAAPSAPPGRAGQITEAQRTSGATRSRAISNELGNILRGAGERADVRIVVHSGGQPSTGSNRTGSHRHDNDHGQLGAADLDLYDAATGRLLDARNPQDREQMARFIREAVARGATGIGFHPNYMGNNRIHVGGGGANTWGVRGGGGASPWAREAWLEGMRDRARGGPPRPPADIPNVPGRAPAVPLPPARPTDQVVRDVTPVDRPPADVPGRLPPVTVPDEAPPTLNPPRAGRPDIELARKLAEGIARSSARPSGQAEGQALANRVAGELARAGFPADIAARVILEGIRQGTREAGYNPDATIMGVSIAARLQEMANTAMQGYRPAARGEPQGPPSPGPPSQQRSALPGQQFAELQPQMRPTEPGLLTPQRQFPQDFGRPGLLDTLGRFAGLFNPISTAEARMSRSDNAALALARTGTSTGGQPGHSVIGHNIFTFYAPGASGPKGIEGPMIGSQNNPLTTLDDVRSGASKTVSLAGHPSQFGKEVFIGNINYRSPIDGKTYTLENVVGRVDDTGGKFMGKDNPDLNKFDIAVGDFSSGWNDTTADAFTRGNTAEYVPAEAPASAVAAQPPVTVPMRGLAKGGHVEKGEQVMVGEEGPETFVPDEPGTVVPYMPRPTGKEIFGKWPRVPSKDFPGQYIGFGGAISNETRRAQDPVGSLMDLVDTVGLRINPQGWKRMLADPRLQALGRARIEDRRNDPYF